MSTYVDPSWTPDRVVRDIYGYSFCMGTGIEQNVDILKRQGFKAVAIRTDQTKEYLDTDWVILAGIPAHFLLVIGMNEHGDLAIYDPYYGVGLSGDEKFYYDKDDIVALYAIKYVGEPAVIYRSRRK
jgi:hypothetical protein